MSTSQTRRGPRPQLLRDAGGKEKFVGTASVFYDENDPEGTQYEMARYGSYRIVERILSSAFASALARPDKVKLTLNHDPNLVLGATESGTLRLWTDAKGLQFSADPPDTSYAKDLMASMRRGDISGASFAFDVLEQSTREVRNPDGSETVIVEVRDVKLWDASITTWGAYAAASSAVRHRPALRGRDRALVARLRADQVGRDLERLVGSPGAGRRTPRSYSLPSSANARGKLALARAVEVESALFV